MAKKNTIKELCCEHEFNIIGYQENKNIVRCVKCSKEKMS